MYIRIAADYVKEKYKLFLNNYTWLVPFVIFLPFKKANMKCNDVFI
jgi:hypothetical protein